MPVYLQHPGRGPNPRLRRRRLSAVRSTQSGGYLLASLIDDFNDNTIDTTQWANNFGTVSETGGRARVTCDTGFNAYSSRKAYILRESGALLQVFPPALGGATTDTWAQVLIKQATAGTDVGFEVNVFTGNLTAFNRVGFSDGSPTTAAYSPTNHAWLRIRESGGQTFWDTSADGSSWANFRTSATPGWVVTDSDLEFQLISHRGDGTNDFAEFDNVNVPPVITTASAEVATVTAAAGDATAGLGAAADIAQVTAVANDATITVTAQADVAIVTASAGDVLAGLGVFPSEGAVTATANAPVAGPGASAEVAAVAVAAGDAAVSLTVTADAAPVTAVSNAPVAGPGASADVASVAAAAGDLTAGLSAAAGVAPVIAVANDATGALAAQADVAPVAAAAGDATAGLGAAADVAPVTVTAYDATGSSIPNTTGSAGLASVSATAGDPTAGLSALSDVALVVGTSPAPTAALTAISDVSPVGVSALDASGFGGQTAQAGSASVSATAFDATASGTSSTTAPAGVAAVSAAVDDVIASILANAELALVSVGAGSVTVGVPQTDLRVYASGREPASSFSGREPSGASGFEPPASVSGNGPVSSASGREPPSTASGREAGQ